MVEDNVVVRVPARADDELVPFDIPGGKTVQKATLRITADDRFTAFVDGKEAGVGGGWRPTPDAGRANRTVQD